MTDRKDTKELASGYTTVNTTQFNAALFLLDRLKVSPEDHVLDVGCGPGNLTLHLKNLVGNAGTVIGFDPSSQRIGIANETQTPGVFFYVGIAEDLSRHADATFDIVFVNSTLHWVQDQPKAIREFGRVLKSGGRLGISGGSGDFVAIHEKIKEDVLSREPYRQYPETGGPNFLKKKELETLLADAGFAQTDIVTNTIVKSAGSPDEMINWLDTSSSGQTYGGIPLDLRPKAREEMKREWEKYINEAGGIDMDMELLVTVAVKG
ncbi:methyltransferase domain-containing protein [Dissoconium aciculare CBS 342.82]|uniref:Methyltransferase domain-containing protein n=1 Tax=Dissoconium aciculare CBS 342.82 TaxID=1314786 RepID=A0A6J3M1T6_9PEZI|nr:methyltransferase domain-containing protein [Dissoconium aciculare CBS 342.82]KAF1821976.1 methyltransferase domain-containing protein [Dissoconium aciculare CBS 342.82]